MCPQLQVLRNLVETTLGKKIASNRDCIELQQDIYRKTSVRLSNNTLRRFAGLITSSHKPSSGTLNSLSLYCGFSSFDEIASLKAQRKKSMDSVLLGFMTSLFKKTITKDEDDSTFINVVQHTIDFLNRHPLLAEPLQTAIAKTSNGQRYYFETFINTDNLGGYFGNGLPHYLAEKQTLEAQIFGNALLAQRNWLTKNDNAFSDFAGRLAQFNLQREVHPFVAGRYFGIAVLSVLESPAEKDATMQKAHKYYLELRPSNYRFSDFPCFELTYATALSLGGQWKEALFFLEQALSKCSVNKPAATFAEDVQSLRLFKALALSRLARKKESENVLAAVKLDGSAFLSKKFHRIIYILACSSRKNKRDTEVLNELVKDTGFVRLLEL